MSPIGEPPPIRYHSVGLREGKLVTWCMYTFHDESEIVEIGRPRARCPRCGAALEPARRRRIERARARALARIRARWGQTTEPAGGSEPTGPATEVTEGEKP